MADPLLATGSFATPCQTIFNALLRVSPDQYSITAAVRFPCCQKLLSRLPISCGQPWLLLLLCGQSNLTVPARLQLGYEIPSLFDPRTNNQPNHRLTKALLNLPRCDYPFRAGAPGCLVACLIDIPDGVGTRFNNKQTSKMDLSNILYVAVVMLAVCSLLGWSCRDHG